MMNRHSNAIGMLACGLLLTGATPLLAQADCEPVFNALNKVMRTPSHIYTSTTTAGKTTNTETIYSTDGIYTNASGSWVRTSTTFEVLRKSEESSRKSGAHVCRYLKDEVVNGEKTAVYNTQFGGAGQKSEGTMWISKTRGLPLRNELDAETAAKGVKNHYSVRYDYNNVTPPKP